MRKQHDWLIAKAAAELADCEALILGQFSMASAAEVIHPHAGEKVLTSPSSAVMRLRHTLVPVAAAAEG